MKRETWMSDKGYLSALRVTNGPHDHIKTKKVKRTRKPAGTTGSSTAEGVARGAAALLATSLVGPVLMNVLNVSEGLYLLFGAVMIVCSIGLAIEARRSR